MQYEELLKANEEDAKKREIEEAKRSQEEAQKVLEIPPQEQERLRAEGRSQVSAQLTELEARTADKLKELQNQINAVTDESQTLKKENETLKKANVEKEERAKIALKSARSRVLQLTEQKQNLEQELNQSRGQADGNKFILWTVSCEIRFFFVYR